MAKDKEGRLKITLSFGEYEEDIYNFLKSQKNTSAFVKRMALAYMGGGSIQLPNTDKSNEPPVAVTVVEHQDPVEEREESKPSSKVLESVKGLDKENLKKLKENLPTF